MKFILPNLACCSLFVSAFMVSCSGGEENKVTFTDKSGEKIVRCYENVYPYKDSSGLKDIEALLITIDVENVTGNYYWLPAEKDARKGDLKGKFINGKINAMYVFMQEGIEDSCEIIIQLKSGKAEVTGGKPELGLNATINEIKCK